MAVLLAVSAVLWLVVLRQASPPASTLRLPWWTLAVMFGLAELCVVHVQVRREAETVSPSEIPLLLGFVFASPVAVVLGRLVGPFLVFLLHRRQSPLKITYNLALQVCDVAVGYTAFVLVRGSADFPETRAVVGLYAGVLAATAVDVLATRTVIGLVEGMLRVPDLLDELRYFPLIDGMVATFGLVAAYALQRDPGSAWALVACLGILLLAYRSYGALADRHLSLERLYQFTQAVSSSPEVDEVLRSVLGKAKELLRAEHAEIVLPADGSSGLTRAVVDGKGRLHRLDVPESEVAALRAMLGQEIRPLLLPRRPRQPELRDYLALRGLREAISVPIRCWPGGTGLLTVADRMGDVRTFDHGDVRLLETVANHSGVALQNGALVDRLRHDALHDGLTGLPNRVLFQAEASAALSEMARGHSLGAAVLLMDLDGFKDVNDTLGHQHGDALLVEVASRLATAVQDPQVALPDLPPRPAGTVARLGGDEFAVLVPDVTGPTQALGVASALLSRLERPVRVHGLDVQIGASIGVALAPAHGTDVSTIMKKADMAMYAAKGEGGARLYAAEIDSHTPSRLSLVAELRDAVARDELVLHVQPEHDLRTGRVDAVEALVRWRHPHHGLLAPDDFVPVAERSGLIQPLTLAVLDAALQACARWRSGGTEVGVAVNLSLRSLRDCRLVEDILGALQRHAVPARLLTLEITESSIMSDPARTIGVLERLRADGVRLSVDDFGTGYSSLSHLRRLPVSEVKIDRSFVTGIRGDPDNAAIVRSIADLGRNLNLDVVAEGVEDPSTRDLLLALGCTRAQGFGLARPMPLEDFDAWVRWHQGVDAPALPVPLAAV